MMFPVTDPPEGPATEAARVRLLARVAPVVHGQRELFLEPLVTNVTLVGFVLQVYLSVVGPALWRGEPLVADVTLQRGTPGVALLVESPR